MTANLLLLFNHNLHPVQEEQAKMTLRVGRIIPPPEKIRHCWGNIPPEAESISAWIEPARKWLADAGRPGDYVLVQGDLGACFLMVSFCLAKGFVPVYATTRRLAREKSDSRGVILYHRFEHVRFRKYGK